MFLLDGLFDHETKAEYIFEMGITRAEMHLMTSSDKLIIEQ